MKFNIEASFSSEDGLVRARLSGDPMEDGTLVVTYPEGKVDRTVTLHPDFEDEEAE